MPDRKPLICPITALGKTNFIKQVILGLGEELMLKYYLYACG